MLRISHASQHLGSQGREGMECGRLPWAEKWLGRLRVFSPNLPGRLCVRRDVSQLIMAFALGFERFADCEECGWREGMQACDERIGYVWLCIDCATSRFPRAPGDPPQTPQAPYEWRDDSIHGGIFLLRGSRQALASTRSYSSVPVCGSWTCICDNCYPPVPYT